MLTAKEQYDLRHWRRTVALRARRRRPATSRDCCVVPAGYKPVDVARLSADLSEARARRFAKRKAEIARLGTALNARDLLSAIRSGFRRMFQRPQAPKISPQPTGKTLEVG